MNKLLPMTIALLAGGGIGASPLHAAGIMDALPCSAAHAADQGGGNAAMPDPSVRSFSSAGCSGAVLQGDRATATVNGDRVELRDGVVYVNGQSYGAVTPAQTVEYEAARERRQVPARDAQHAPEHRQCAQQAQRSPAQRRRRTADLAAVVGGRHPPVCETREEQVVVDVRRAAVERGERFVVAQHACVPARHDGRDAAGRPPLRIFDEPARLRRQDLGDVRGGQVTMPAVGADRAVLQQPQLRAVPRPFDVARHVMERAQHALQEVPQLPRAQAVRGRERAALPRLAEPRQDRALRAGLPVGERFEVAFDPFDLDREMAHERDAGQHGRDEALHDGFLEAAVEQFGHARGRLRCRYAQERRVQAGVRRVGLVLAMARRADRPFGVGLAREKTGQARIVGSAQRQRRRHRQPGHRSQREAPAFGMRNEARVVSFEPLRERRRRIDPWIVPPAGLQRDGQVGAREDRRPRGGLTDAEHGILVAPHEFDAIGDPLEQRQRGIGAHEIPVRQERAATGIAGAHAAILRGRPGPVRELAGEQRRVVGEQPVDGLAQRLRRHQFRQAPLPQERADRGEQHAAAEVAGAPLQRVQDQQRIHADRHDCVPGCGRVQQRLRIRGEILARRRGMVAEARQLERHGAITLEVGQRVVPPVGGAAVAGEEVQDRLAHEGFVGRRSSRLPRFLLVLPGASGMEA
ncbi:hypothetical protein [Burkholderia cenocepacia]|uniref:hypothetical protein n=1 Tax=Burkholderia cenocepacia TaxID=95486 RepID=UPI002AB61579|nr:hypothetical protein [Burkholderia cenocepacia]